MGCARRTVGRWLRWLASVADPGDLQRHLLSACGEPMLPSLGRALAKIDAVADALRRQLLGRAADALVLIDFINKRYRSGMTRREAITSGVHIRLRPILLTTLTTTLGLLPMAVGFPSYSLVWGTMASTFVTGLAAATALTLFIIPVLWDLLLGLQERIARQRAGSDVTSES
jgi:hypothetical protein